VSAAPRKRLPLLCPSSRLERPDAKVLGVLGEDGRLQFLAEPRPVTPEFAAAAQRGRDPHLRFRFTSACGQSACGSWKDGGCGIAEIEVAALEPDAGPLPECAIRPQCRWYQQRGDAACRVCPQVVHSLFVDEPT